MGLALPADLAAEMHATHGELRRVRKAGLGRKGRSMTPTSLRSAMMPMLALQLLSCDQNGQNLDNLTEVSESEYLQSGCWGGKGIQSDASEVPGILIIQPRGNYNFLTLISSECRVMIGSQKLSDIFERQQMLIEVRFRDELVDAHPEIKGSSLAYSPDADIRPPLDIYRVSVDFADVRQPFPNSRLIAEVSGISFIERLRVDFEEP